MTIHKKKVKKLDLKTLQIEMEGQLREKKKLKFRQKGHKKEEKSKKFFK